MPPTKYVANFCQFLTVTNVKSNEYILCQSKIELVEFKFFIFFFD